MSHPKPMFFLWKVSNPESRHQKLQEDGIGTLTGIVDIPLSGAERIKSWSRHQKLQEDGIGTLTGIVDIPLSGAERIKSWSRHQNCKRIG